MIPALYVSGPSFDSPIAKSYNFFMEKRTQLVLLSLILIVAAVLRLSFLDWDGYNHYHPDERYIAWVGTSIEWPDSYQTALSPHESSFNPFYWPPDATSTGVVLEQDQPRRFAYGHLPLYMGVAFTRGLEVVEPSLSRILPAEWKLTSDLLNHNGRNEFRHITAAGRALTALVDLASVLLLFFLGRLTFSPAVGLLASAFLAVNVMHLQLARFFAVDPYLTFFVLLALTFMVLSIRDQVSDGLRVVLTLLAGIVIGLATGSKFGGILLFIPMAMTVIWQIKWPVGRRLLMLLIAGLLAFIVFSLTNPFALLDNSCQVDGSLQAGPIQIPGLLLKSCYLQNVALQGTMVRGLRDVPFVRQYAGTTPYLYFVEMQLRWGMGLLLGLVGFAGLIWTSWRVFKAIIQWWQGRSAKPSANDDVKIEPLAARFPVTAAEIILLSWSLPLFLTTGAFEVKFMRYLQPLIPLLMLYGAAMLMSVRKIALRRVAIALVLILTTLYALSFINLYRQDHPWIEASRWIFENVPEESRVVSEIWDDRLPDNVVVAGEMQSRDIYELVDVNWLSGTENYDNPEKLEGNLALIAEADYLVLSSNRNYGVIPRLPERYPLSNQYYRLLFEGQLGFDIAYVGSRFPNLFGIYLKPDSFSWTGLESPSEVIDYLDSFPGPNWGRFDESFTVYDQPMVIILQNKAHMTADEMKALFDGA